MSTISLLRLWNDPGFTDGCVEVPAYDHLSTLPNADITIGTVGDEPTSAEINPSKGRLFSELKLRRAYSDCQNLSYLEMTVDYNTGTDRVYYGFIDSVEIVSDTDEYPAVLIKWHVDLWRTYLSDAVFGYGMVRRRPASGNYPMQNIPYSNIRASTAVELFGSGKTSRTRYVKTFTRNNTTYDVYWLYIAWSYESNDNQTVTQYYTVLPIPVYQYEPQPIADLYLAPQGQTVSDMKVSDLFSSDYLTEIGIAPSSITCACVSPLCPFADGAVSVGTVDDSAGVSHPCLFYSITGAPAVHRVTVEGQTYVYPFVACPLLDVLGSTIDYYSEPHVSSEKHTLVVCDFRGLKVGTLPPRLPVAGQEIRPVPTATRFYWEISFVLTNPLGPADAYEFRKQNGLYFELNCPTWPVSSNSWSEYVVSQARTIEMQNRKLSNEMAVYNGLSQAITGGTQGAMMGGLKESQSFLPSNRTIANATAFGALGAVGQVTGSLAEYAVATSYADDLQGLSDRASAGQIDTLIFGGDDIVWINECELPQIISLSKDNYSATQFDSQLALNGVDVSEPTADCTALVHGTGPLAIENLIVRGNIPAVAKQYIKARLNKGVRLV